MPKGINYGQAMYRAMCSMIADVLGQVARDGLPGKHYFLITFDTTHPGVDMAQSLRERYPGEMTILMQDWFTDLAVMKDRFTVTLNFGDVPEPIVIPYEAIKTFADPSVEFGLKLKGREPSESPHEEVTRESRDPTPIRPAPAPASAPEGEVIKIDFRKH